jgi:hypothetical protein
MRATKMQLFLLVVFLVLFSARYNWAQVVTGTLTGTVTDATGATVPNAKITITELSTSAQRSTTTSADGLYNVPYLAPGEYKVEVSATGFKSFTQSDITVSVSTVARLNTVLTLGNASETVTVTAAPPPLQTESVEVAVNLSAQQVTDVPMEARNVLQGSPQGSLHRSKVSPRSKIRSAPRSSTPMAKTIRQTIRLSTGLTILTPSSD